MAPRNLNYYLLPLMTEWFLAPFVQEYNLLYLPWKLNGMLLQSRCLMCWKVFQEIKCTGVDFLSLLYFESLRNFKWTRCNTLQRFLYTKLCYTISGAVISITLICYLGVSPGIWNLRTYMSLWLLCKSTHGLTLKFQKNPEKWLCVLNIYC